MTKGGKVVGVHLQTMLIGGGKDVANKFLVSGTFQTPITESEVKTYIQTIIDGKTPPQDNKLTPQNAAAMLDDTTKRLPFYVTAENNAHKFEYTANHELFVVNVYSDSALATDKTGAPVNQVTLSSGESIAIRDDFPIGEYVIVTLSHATIPPSTSSIVDNTYIFQMQTLDENVYLGGGRQLALVATCYSKFKSRYEDGDELDSLYALAVGKHLVSQLKSGMSPKDIHAA